MSNKGGRVSPDYLADIAPEYAYQGEHTPFDAVDDGFEKLSSVSCNEEAGGIIL